MGDKSTNAVVEERVSKIHRWLLLGVRRRDILQYAAKQKWGVTDSQVDNYIAKANAMIRESADIDRAVELGKAIERLADLYRACIEDKDYKGARQVQKDLTELLGLAEAATMNVKFDFGDMQGAMDSWRESIRAMRSPKPETPDA